MTNPRGRVAVVMLLGLLDAFPRLGDGGPQQPGAEEVEHPGEVLDEGGTRQNEEQAQHQRNDDAGEQNLLLILPRYPEAGDHDDEDEEVVDTQGLLGDVPREVLLAVLASPHACDDEAEDHGHGHISHRPPGGLPHGGLVGSLDVTDDIHRDHGQDNGGQSQPSEGVDVH